MAIAKVQGAYYTYGTTPITASFVSTPTEGNLLIAYGRSQSNSYTNGSIPGWTRANGVKYSFYGYHGLWYKVAGAAESKDVTLTWTSSAGTHLIIEEWGGFDGVPTLDQIASAATESSNVTSKTSGTTPTTTADNELCMAGFAFSAVTSSQTWSNSFVLEYNVFNYSILGSRVVSSTGEYETTASWTTGVWAGGTITTFKGVPAATPWTPKVIFIT